jgi:TRAP-type C4-dicarboxylate transport system substrate-binding protein
MTRIPGCPALAVTKSNPRLNAVAGIASMMTALLLSFAAAAEPITLKLSFVGSEDISIYRYGIKPFVDGINREGDGLLKIDVYPNGTLVKALAEQPQMVLEGRADIAYVVPGQTPYRFPDNALIELPGQFRDAREGTLAYSRLIAANALRGYQEYFVIGAYTSDPSTIHSRKSIDSLAAIEGQRLRANNQIEAEVLERLGAKSTILPASQLAKAVGSGAIDGVTMGPTALFDYGIGPLAKNHYLLRGGVAPLLLVMNRRTFDGLPDAAQALIRRFSGERSAATWIESYARSETQALEKIKSDPRRKVIEPSPSDLETAQRVYRSLIDTWAAESPHNRELLKMIGAELATIRSNNR